MKLKDMPNIGGYAERLLVSVGIDTPEKLISEGAEKAFLKVMEADSTVCFCFLCGLEGAVEGVKWHKIKPERKETLNKFFKSVKGK